MKKLESIVAEKLLNISAIKLQPDVPFVWASGWNSPIYTDNRKTLSYPELRTFIKVELCRTIAENFEKPDAIAGQKVVVIEDLISTGGSSLKAVEAIRNAGCEVVGMVAIFTYGFPVSVKRFNDAGVKLITLSNYNSMLEAALETNYIKQEDLETLKQWRKDPANWVPNRKTE